MSDEPRDTVPNDAASDGTGEADGTAGEDETITPEQLEQRRERLDQRERGLDDRAVELDDREAALETRAAELDERRDRIGELRDQLDERAAELDQREADLDDREAAIEQREAELSERAESLNQKEATLYEYVSSEVADLEDELAATIEGAVSAGMGEHAEESSTRVGTAGGVAVGLLGAILLGLGVANGIAAVGEVPGLPALGDSVADYAVSLVGIVLGAGVILTETVSSD